MARKKIRRQQDDRQSINIQEQLKTVDTGVKGGVFVFKGPLSVSEFSKQIDRQPAEIIKKFFMKGIVTNLNTVLNEDQIGELCLEFGYDFSIQSEVTEENLVENITIVDSEENLVPRPPIITIMGHVDHGKTTLLDSIRKTSIASGEAGGITQHIGAYKVSHDSKEITFIDTPGHEAFSKMRARGANVTDVVILVVAADDGLMPQTEEAIDHARFAKVPIIVFINKMDKADANPDRVMGQLAEKDIMPEEWGGKIPFVKGSARNMQGLDDLLDVILLTAEMANFRANPNRLAVGTVLESRLDKGMGPVATLIVNNGTLKKGDIIVAGMSYGRVRMLFDHNREQIAEAPPGTPVQVSGLLEIPTAGDKFVVINDEKQARQIADSRKQKLQREQRATVTVSDEIKAKIESGELKNLNIILKADMQGSLEALKGVLTKIEINGAHISLVRSSTGAITESDISLAQTSKALIYAFNIRASQGIAEAAKEKGLDIRYHNVIYKLKEEIESVLRGKLDPIIEEEISGQAEVINTWKHTEIGTIAGCKVTSGSIMRNLKVRIIRDSIIIFTGEISSMKHIKDDIKEAKVGKECGITIRNFNDIKVGDIVETFKLIEKLRTDG